MFGSRDITFQYEACHRFRAGASVHKLFVGGVPYHKISKSFEAKVIRSLENLTDASNSNPTERPVNLELSDSSKRTSLGFETSSDYTCPACVLNVWGFSSACH